MGHRPRRQPDAHHIVGRALRGQAIDEYQYVNSAGDGIELKPGDYELTVDEPPVATDGTRFRASKRMVPVSFNSQAPDTVDSTPQADSTFTQSLNNCACRFSLPPRVAQ